MKKMNNKHGFTLAELLIVVAIIAVLVAISIPIFTSQLEKSREAVDLANMRAAYAECSATVLTGEASSTNCTLAEDKKSASYEVTLKQQKAGWTGDNATAKIGNTEVPTISADTKKVTVSVTDAGVVTLTPGT